MLSVGVLRYECGTSKGVYVHDLLSFWLFLAIGRVCGRSALDSEEVSAGGADDVETSVVMGTGISLRV